MVTKPQEACDHGVSFDKECLACYGELSVIGLQEGRVVSGGPVVRLSDAASKRFAEIASQSTVKDGKTYAQRMREKAERARRNG